MPDDQLEIKKSAAQVAALFFWKFLLAQVNEYGNPVTFSLATILSIQIHAIITNRGVQTIQMLG